MQYVSGASWIWPKFRDDRNELDVSGNFHPALEKNPELEREWHDIDARFHVSNATSDSSMRFITAHTRQPEWYQYGDNTAGGVRVA
jgi:hypothetical protein